LPRLPVAAEAAASPFFSIGSFRRPGKNGFGIALAPVLPTGGLLEHLRLTGHPVSAPAGCLPRELPARLASHPISGDWCEVGPDGTNRVKIASILETRCARCHAEGKSSSAAQAPLDNWEQIHAYCEVELPTLACR
jgi:hypothetical protein